MTLDLNLVSLVLGLASLVLGGVAIWLSLHFKREADTVNQQTVQLLLEIRTDAKAISAFAIPELQRYGDTSRQIMAGAAMTGSQIMPITSGTEAPRKDVDDAS